MEGVAPEHNQAEQTNFRVFLLQARDIASPLETRIGAGLKLVDCYVNEGKRPGLAKLSADSRLPSEVRETAELKLAAMKLASGKERVKHYAEISLIRIIMDNARPLSLRLAAGRIAIGYIVKTESLYLQALAEDDKFPDALRQAAWCGVVRVLSKTKRYGELFYAAANPDIPEQAKRLAKRAVVNFLNSEDSLEWFNKEGYWFGKDRLFQILEGSEYQMKIRIMAALKALNYEFSNADLQRIMAPGLPPEIKTAVAIMVISRIDSLERLILIEESPDCPSEIKEIAIVKGKKLIQSKIFQIGYLESIARSGVPSELRVAAGLNAVEVHRDNYDVEFLLFMSKHEHYPIEVREKTGLCAIEILEKKVMSCFEELPENIKVAAISSMHGLTLQLAAKAKMKNPDFDSELKRKYLEAVKASKDKPPAGMRKVPTRGELR